ncbi:ABC transporter ATP-binding protein, partial [bacterium]|nr:ABC transporter ATP-binding protein [bacterium]
MNQNEVVLSLSGICKNYGKFEALKPIDLQIRKGELFGFLGPNGAGKTTLIRIITGLIKQTSGSVFLGGMDLAKEPEKAKARVGYVPDRPYLYEKLTPLEYFDFVGGLYSVPHKDLETRGEEMLRKFSLWERRNDLIESFSHGMKQKVAMASAFLHDPDILVVDEPMVGLDPKSVRLVKDFFCELCGRGKTFFMSTHTLSLAEDICHRIGIINHGILVAMGTIGELRELGKDPNQNLEEIF